MKAVVYEAPNVLKIRQIEEVNPGRGEVKIRVRACGICGSDVHGYLGLTGRRIPPMVMGHEFAGDIVALGEGCTSFQVGCRVAAYPVDFCGHCKMCVSGQVHLCLHKKAYGVLETNGALAEYICVPEKCCFALQDTVSYELGSLMEPLAVAYRGVEHAGSLEGRDVLLVGTGTIGLLALACIKMKHPGRIFVSDLSDSRLAIAKEMGADIVINPGREDLKEIIGNYTDGEGVDAAIEAVGAAVTVRQAMSALKLAGTAVWIGNNQPLIEINMQEIVTRELKVYGSFLYGYEEFKKVVSYVNEGSLRLEPLISLSVSLEEAPAYFEKLAHAPGDLIKVIVKQGQS